jgi:hypothetical protein
MMRFHPIPMSAVALAIVTITIAGCAPEYRPEDHGEGETLRHNFLLQAVNPRPNEIAVAPDQDGRRAESAYDRYREGKVFVPKRITTSDTAK